MAHPRENEAQSAVPTPRTGSSGPGSAEHIPSILTVLSYTAHFHWDRFGLLPRCVCPCPFDAQALGRILNNLVGLLLRVLGSVPLEAGEAVGHRELLTCGIHSGMGPSLRM